VGSLAVFPFLGLLLIGGIETSTAFSFLELLLIGGVFPSSTKPSTTCFLTSGVGGQLGLDTDIG
ncbi:hypothetical protein FRX31_004074, partial [Thalictrum thalictroides]